MKRAILLIIVGALYVLHQDFWFWRAARPLVFGFIPIGLFYHAGYTVVTALVMWLLVKHAWPSELEERVGDEGRGDGARGRGGEGAKRRGVEGASERGGDRPVAVSPPLPLAPTPSVPPRPVDGERGGER